MGEGEEVKMGVQEMSIVDKHWESMDQCRREIMVRIERETEYIKVLVGSNLDFRSKDLLMEKIRLNDEHLRLLGRFLREHGDLWEKFYEENRPK